MSGLESKSTPIFLAAEIAGRSLMCRTLHQTAGQTSPERIVCRGTRHKRSLSIPENKGRQSFRFHVGSAAAAEKGPVCGRRLVGPVFRLLQLAARQPMSDGGAPKRILLFWFADELSRIAVSLSA
jgi:hypothetical protein